MAHFSKRNRRREREEQQALNNRLELVKEGFTRRDLIRMGLMTSAGVLIPKSGLTHAQTAQSSSSWGGGGSYGDHNSCYGGCNVGCSPQPAQVFVDPLPIPPELPARPITDPGLQFGAPPSLCPNNTPNPNNGGLPYEGRGQFNGSLRPGTDCFQFFNQYAPQQFFVQRLRANPNFRFTSDTNIPAQTIWGFNTGGSSSSDVATFPAPTVVTRYQQPWVVRRFNELPTQSQNGGFGVPEVSAHLHNFHTAPESDGGPCRWFFRGQYFDYYYTAQQAGFASDHQPGGDINESLSTLWYHDHRIDHTAENVYKGMAGFHLMFNQYDTGNETTGFRLPSYPQYDIPIMLADKLLDPSTGLLCFDTFNFKGLLGDLQLANGVIQPYLNVSARRYRFRVLDGGPSRFYELFLTDPLSPSTVIPFWVVANDGNLLPTPIQVTSFRLSVGERYDIIIDFNQVKKLIGSHTAVRLENRLQQTDGQGPSCNVLAAGQGVSCVEFRIGAAATDNSVDPATHPAFYQLPSIVTPRITRNFKFDRNNGQWTVNNRFASCNELRFTVTQNSAENWVIQNPRDDWQHPIHVHFEEHQILTRSANGGRYSSYSGSGYNSSYSNGCAFQGGGGGMSASRSGVPNVEVSRKDVTRLQGDEDAKLFFRFRDFTGDYPMHCHNVVHEDHAMMLLFQVQSGVTDNNQNP